MSNPWFRVYSGLIDDPKFIKLGPDLRSALLMMWCVAGANDGRLPPIEDIAIKFRLSETRTIKLLAELRHCGWIDDDGSGSEPHNWKGRQYISDRSIERVKRHRAKQASAVSGNADVTLLKRPQTTEQITEQNRTDKNPEAKASGDRSRGTRLPEDWEPAESDLAFAQSVVPSPQIPIELAKFKDHWRAANGPPSIKRDWSAAWRNWCRRSVEMSNNKGFQNGRSGISADRSASAGADRVLEKLSQFGNPPPRN